tara:strand:+ start:400 stop:861 length:462 start_codon:yes stop_codon:yes gene_type:complete
MTTTKKESHAITNARGQLESIKELYRKFKKEEEFESWDCGSNVYNWTTDGIQEEARNGALSVEFRSGWSSNLEKMEPEEFKILLSTGGPACQIIGKLDQYKQPTDIEIQYQDWGTPWEPLQLNSTYADKSPNITSDYEALEWFCNCFYFGDIY